MGRDETAVWERYRIKLIGIGGAGRNFVDAMIEDGLPGVEFFVIDPSWGSQSRTASTELSDELEASLADIDSVILVGGFGGNTGTAWIPIAADTAASRDIQVSAVVTEPFWFEGPKRIAHAEAGLKGMRGKGYAVTIVSSDKAIAGLDLTYGEALKHISGIVAETVRYMICGPPR